MGPELESKGRSEATSEASASKEDGVVSADSTEKHLKCESNYGGDTLEIGGLMAEPLVACRSNDAEVNITAFTNSGGNGLVKAECQEETENSSSFDDTDSGFENAANLSDSEVISGFHGDGSSALAINGFADIFRLRKKKLTPHWRTYARPITWRCKWAELQIKMLEAQTRKCHRELVKYNQRKHFESKNLEMQGICMKSFPFSSDCPSDKVLKRKKRRRIEETMNAASYMLHHNLFSYYEKRIHSTDGTYADVDWGNQDKLNGNDESEDHDEGFGLESRNGDNSVEQMFRKIGILQSQVSNLKSRLNKVKSKNPGKLSLVDNLGFLVSSNGLASSARSLASPPNNGDRMPVGSSNIASQLILQYNMGNVPESAVSSHGEVSFLPDVIESTNQSFLGGTCTNTEDDILIYSERMKEGMHNFDEVGINCMEKPPVAEAHTQRAFSTVLVEQDLPADDQPAPKIRSISKLITPKSRKKRGRRKVSR